MRRILSVIAVMTILSGCIKEKQTGTELKVGDSLPDFEVVMNDGSSVTDEILRQETSVIMFFHTSCPDCQQVLPEMQKIYAEYSSKGVLFAFISRDESFQDIDIFWNKKGFEMPYSAQNDRVVYEKFARTRIPRVYINEKGGIIRYIFTDDPNPSYDVIKSALEDVIH